MYPSRAGLMMDGFIARNASEHCSPRIADFIHECCISGVLWRYLLPFVWSCWLLLVVWLICYAILSLGKNAGVRRKTDQHLSVPALGAGQAIINRSKCICYLFNARKRNARVLFCFILATCMGQWYALFQCTCCVFTPFPRIVHQIRTTKFSYTNTSRFCNK